MPVIGGIIVGFMAKYASPKIKGHGIPEAMEAVLAKRSRIEPRVALLKPISVAIAIRDGWPFRCRRANYSNRRGDWIAHRAGSAGNGIRA
ncbi:MAG: chloride channel protein [Candidatus Sulfotelmatobacter sp.]